jgi:uncharacterized protein
MDSAAPELPRKTRDDLTRPESRDLASRFELFQFREKSFAFLPEALMPIEITDGVSALLASLSSGSVRPSEALSEDLDDAASILTLAAAVPRQRARPDLGPSEKTYSVNTHTSCNLSCSYCFRTAAPVKPRPLGETIGFVDRVMDFIVRDSAGLEKTKIQFSMLGEPLLDFPAFQHLSRRVAEARERTGRQFWLTMLTNGTLLDRPTVDWMLENGTVFGVSIDGAEDLHDISRPDTQGRGSYSTLRENLQYSLSRPWGRFPPGATATVSAKNTAVDRVFTHLYELGFRVICFNLVRAPADSPLALTGRALDEVKAAFERLAIIIIEDAGRGSLNLLDAVFYSGSVFADPLFQMLTQVERRASCGMVDGSMIVITPDGAIHRCESMTDGRFRMGDIETGFTTPPIDWEDASPDEDRACSRCTIRYMCGGPCAHASFLWHGRYDRVVDSKCELQRHLVRLGAYLIARLIEVYPPSIERLRRLVAERNAWELPTATR